VIKLVDTNDDNAVRNLNNIVNLHEVMINQSGPSVRSPQHSARS